MNVLDVLNDKVAQELLASTQLARLAYTWRDGTPRVVPIWFHWTGSELVMASPQQAKGGAQAERYFLAPRRRRDHRRFVVAVPCPASARHRKGGGTARASSPSTQPPRSAISVPTRAGPGLLKWYRWVFPSHG